MGKARARRVTPTAAAKDTLAPDERREMGRRLGRDLSDVQVHTDDAAHRAAAAHGADAVTAGNQVSVGSGAQTAGPADRRRLIAHELAHVVQQRGGSQASSVAHAGPETLEAQADKAATALVRGSAMPPLSAAPAGTQRRVSMRDVGRGEQSGFARVEELVERLNVMSKGLQYDVTGGFLTYKRVEGGTLSEFDRQMVAYIDEAADIPMRFTNRHGLLGDKAVGFHWAVEVDSWLAGYVDIDDLLASSDIGLQTSLVHLLRERQLTRNYARRIGTPSLDASQPAPAAEFRVAHARGIDAELAVLRDYFGDPSIRIVDANSRRFRNDRRDSIREKETARHGAEEGVLAITWEVALFPSGTVISAEEYRERLEIERQVARERLQGATEHREGGRSVPAP